MRLPVEIWTGVTLGTILKPKKITKSQCTHHDRGGEFHIKPDKCSGSEILRSVILTVQTQMHFSIYIYIYIYIYMPNWHISMSARERFISCFLAYHHDSIVLPRLRNAVFFFLHFLLRLYVPYRSNFCSSVKHTEAGVELRVNSKYFWNICARNALTFSLSACLVEISYLMRKGYYQETVCS
jgi:hypothetical protein